jgi:hypothetical protein
VKRRNRTVVIRIFNANARAGSLLFFYFRRVHPVVFPNPLIMVKFPSTQQYKMRNTINRCSDCVFIAICFGLRRPSSGNSYEWDSAGNESRHVSISLNKDSKSMSTIRV